MRDTAQKIAAGEAVVGGPTLEQASPGLPKLLSRWWGWREGKGKSRSKNGGEETPTHDELRDLWAANHPGHAHGHGEWKRYENGVWRPVPENIIKRQIVATLEAAKADGVRPTSWLLSSVLDFAQVQSAVADEKWDADPDILVCRNGTLEISSGTLREHRPEDFALGAVPYEFDADAHAPTWYSLPDVHRARGGALPAGVRWLLPHGGYFPRDGRVALRAAGEREEYLIEGSGPCSATGPASWGSPRCSAAASPSRRYPARRCSRPPSSPPTTSVTHLLNAIISGERSRVEEKFKPAYTVTPRAKMPGR